MGPRSDSIQYNTGENVKAKNALRDEHGPGHVTPAGRSVFYDLFPRDKADELVMRATLLSGLEGWLKKSKLTRAQAAKTLRITQARVSDIKRGKIGQFSLDMLVRLASRAGLKPKLKLVPINSFPPVYAAEPKLNIEFGPGIGPSASTSVLT